MPSLNQNLIKFEKDYFIIRYNVVDATTSLGTNNYAAWYGIANGTAASDGILKEGWTTTVGPSPITSYNVSIGPDGCSSTSATALTAGTAGDITYVNVFDFHVDVIIDLFTLNTITDGDYYTELVLMPMVSNVAYQCKSTVAATGILTVKDSMFTEYPLR